MITTAATKKQIRPMKTNAFFVSFSIAMAIFVGLRLAIFRIGLYENTLILLASTLFIMLIFYIIFKVFMITFNKYQAWSFDQKVLSSPRFKESIPVKQITKAYFGMKEPKRKFQSSLYYKNIIVLELSNGQHLALSLYHLENGPEIMKSIKRSVESKLDSDIYPLTIPTGKLLGAFSN